MFGRRKTPPPAPANTEWLVPVDDEPSAGRRPSSPLHHVIVPESAFRAACSDDPQKSYAIVQAVINFVNAMSKAHYDRNEICQKAVQAYHLDYYYAQVLNGGHTQFASNSGANLELALADARMALSTMSAVDYLAIADGMLSWLDANKGNWPQPLDYDAWYETTSKPFDSLDKAFYALDKANSLIRCNARWIAGWPELLVVSDAEYPQMIQHLAEANPNQSTRKRVAELTRIIGCLTSDMIVGANLACTRMQTPAFVIKIKAGQYFKLRPESDSQIFFYVQTNVGERLIAPNDDCFAVYEVTQSSHRGPGDMLAFASRDDIDQFKTLAVRLDAGFALHSILERSNLPIGTTICPFPVEQHPTHGASLKVAILANGKIYLFGCSAQAAMLFDLDTRELIARSSRAEIESYKAGFLH
jgi:hypothetical protein